MKAIHIYLDWLDGRNKDYHPKGVYTIRDMIAWLKKHGEPVEINPTEFDTRLQALIGKFDSLPKEELIGSLSFWLNVVQNDGTYKIDEKQDEQKLANSAKTCKDEQKPVDKVEPKFHESEWVVYECAEETATLQITRIVGKTYVFSDNSTLGVVDEDALRLWDITKDAKDGDVLVTPLPKGCEAGEQIFVFKGINSRDYVDNCIEYYCRICQGVFYENEIGYMGTTSETFYPATKEQRDTLMKAMADAGYEWSEETHELKKIEDEEYNGEDYGIDSLFHAQRILEKTLGKVNGYQTDDGILSHECAITAVKKLYEQKPAEWSEEDMSKVQRICKYLNEAKKYYADITEVRECMNWLKSLKDRVQPKQEWSEEDIRNIENIDSILFYDKDLSEDTCVRLRNWLESLKPQNHWKPTEEQIRALHDLNLTGNMSYAGQGQVLIELYNDLKKLIE